MNLRLSSRFSRALALGLLALVALFSSGLQSAPAAAAPPVHTQTPTPIIGQQEDVVFDIWQPFFVVLDGADRAGGRALTWTATGMPDGVKMHSSGLLYGSADESGEFTITATATSITGAASSMAFEMSINFVMPAGDDEGRCGNPDGNAKRGCPHNWD